MNMSKLKQLRRDMQYLVCQSQLLLVRYEELMNAGYPPFDVEPFRVETWGISQVEKWLADTFDEDESDEE